MQASRVRPLSFLVKAGQLLNSSAPLGDRLVALVQEMVQELGASRAAFLVLEEARRLVDHGFSFGFPPQDAFSLDLVPGSFEGRLLASGGPVGVPDLQAEGLVAAELAGWLGTRAAYFCPLIYHERPLGMLAMGFGLGQWPGTDPQGREAHIAEAAALHAAMAIAATPLFKGDSYVRLRAILESVAEAVMVVDGGGQTVIVNRAYLELMGCRRITDSMAARVQAREIKLRRLDGTVLATAEHPGVRAINGQAVRHEDHRVTAIDGREKVVRVSANPVRDEDGYVVYGCITLQDVSELVEVRRYQDQIIAERTLALQEANAQLRDALDELRATNAELHNLDRLKADFLNTVSHELRTPLSRIVGFTELLEDELAGPLMASQRECVEAILAGAQELLRLIENLLDYARMEAGDFPIDRRRVEYGDLVLTTLGYHRPGAHRRAIELACRIPDDPVRVHLDPDRTAQVLHHLLENALKFTPEGGRIEVRFRLEGRELVTEVEDTGIGIPPESLDKIFQKFYQVDSSSTRAAGGAGLGLAISKTLVEAMGGAIAVTSDEQRGSTFRFVLPV